MAHHNPPKLKAGTTLARIRVAFRKGLETLWRSGVRPTPKVPTPRCGQFPGLASAEQEFSALQKAGGAAEAEPFASSDPLWPAAELGVVPARRPSASRLYVGH